MKLLPCPFCSSKAKMQEHESGAHYIECSNPTCGTSTNLQYSEKQDGQLLLVERWNRRDESRKLARIFNALAESVLEEDDSAIIAETTKAEWQAIGELRDKCLELVRPK